MIATRHDPAKFKPSTLRFPSNLFLEEPIAFQVLVLGRGSAGNRISWKLVMGQVSEK
jgi:hypothetical protein